MTTPARHADCHAGEESNRPNIAASGSDDPAVRGGKRRGARMTHAGRADAFQGEDTALPLPQELDAERAVLAALMLGAEMPPLDACDFHQTSHGSIFRAITALRERGAPADMITVAAELRRRGDLEAVGGPPMLSHLLEYAATTANTAHHARIVREAAVRRETLRAADDLSQAMREGSRAIPDALARFDERRARAVAGLDGPTRRLVDASLDAAAFAQLEIPARQHILGNGLVRAGDLFALYGQPGLGKTWLALQQLRSFARQTDWLGLPAVNAPLNVGFLSLELSADVLQERARLLGIGSHEGDCRIHIVARPMLRGIIDFCQIGNLAELEDWIRSKQLQVCIVDALSRAHSAKESSGDSDGLGGTILNLDAMALDTGCAIGLVHHERKAQAGERDDDDLSPLRGTTMLATVPKCLMRVVERGGQRAIRWAKVNQGEEPETLWYSIDASMGAHGIAGPEQRAHGNRLKVEVALQSARGQSMSQGEIREQTGLGSTSVKDHLSELLRAGLAKRTGEGRATRWYWCGAESAVSAAEDERPYISNDSNDEATF